MAVTIQAGCITIREDGLVNLKLPTGEEVEGLPKNQVETFLEWIDSGLQWRQADTKPRQCVAGEQ